MRTLKSYRIIVAMIAVILLVLGAAACDTSSSEASAQKKESNTRQGSYEALTAAQPAQKMSYSPTRDTINKWITTWNQRGQLSFTYLLNQDGEKIGYWVFVGPPVTYCAALTPTYDTTKVDTADGRKNDLEVIVPAPSVDGVYYSGGQCIQYYGVDASTGQLIEFTVGGTLNFVNSTQPLYRDVEPLGPTEISDVKANADGEYILK